MHSYRKTRNRRPSLGSRLIRFRDLSYRQIGEQSGKSKQAVGFGIEGSVRLDPVILTALLELTGDAAFVAEVQEASRADWIEQHPNSDPATHLQGSTSEVPS